MAVRSGAGTGVIVSLVVFILTTVFLLFLAIIFYAGKTDAEMLQSQAEDSLAQYVKPAQRSLFKSFEQDAAAHAESVAEHLHRKHELLLRFVNGDTTATLEQVQLELDVADGDTLRNVLQRQNRTIRTSANEIDGLKTRVAAREAEIAEKDAQIARMRDDQAVQLEMVSTGLKSYREAGDQYGQDVQTTIAEMKRSVENLRARNESHVENLEEDIDDLGQELVLLRSRVNEYESIFDRIRMKATNPELLVDGSVLDVDLSNKQVYIDRGRTHRIVLGMTFEVYDDAASIRVDERAGTLPRGKASLQVIKVGENTATCKITRAIPGRPIVRNNVIANAIYDPSYRFKFLIHGKFDVDGDGRPSEAEAEYLRSLVIDWGGEIVVGNELPGDLDFLVVGQEPPRQGTLRGNATQAEEQRWMQRRQARQKYDELVRRASDAQIPVLNSNRFFILIGHTGR